MQPMVRLHSSLHNSLHSNSSSSRSSSSRGRMASARGGPTLTGWFKGGLFKLVVAAVQRSNDVPIYVCPIVWLLLHVNP